MNMFSFRIHSLLENVNNLSIFFGNHACFPLMHNSAAIFVHIVMVNRKRLYQDLTQSR